MSDRPAPTLSMLAVIFALGFSLGGIIALTGYTLYRTADRQPTVRPLELPLSAVMLPELLPVRAGDAADGAANALLAEEFVSQQQAFVGPGLINFFASWCAPCEQEHPVLMRIAAGQIPVYGVLYHDRPEAGAAMLRRLGSPFRRVLVDELGESAVEYGLTGVPETLLIDSAGRVRGRWVGVLSQQAWQQELLPQYESLRKPQPPQQ